MLRLITDYNLYKHRYAIGYILVGLLVSTLLVAAALYVPGGLREEEIISATSSSRLSIDSFNPESAIDLPYSLLQSASFALFGITTLSIKLPSLILGILSLLGIILLLRNWFRANVAVIAALIVITTSQFIFASQDGTPTIMYIFLSTWLLFLALKVSRQFNQRSFWEFLLIAALALSLYTPLSVYIILALVSATLLHPHLRFIVARLSRKKLLAAGALGLVLLAPLIMALISKPEIGLTLLGIPETPIDLKENVTELARANLSFIMPSPDRQPQSLYTLPSMLLMILGLTRLFQTRHTARSYIIFSWIILLAPVILLNPTKTAVTYVPVMLLIAAGIDVLLHRWYSLFPRNPYARVAGLVPITILIGGMSLVGIERYFYVYRYSPPVVAEYSNDLRLLNEELSRLENQPVTLRASGPELPFYEAVAKYDDQLHVASPDQSAPNDQPVIATRQAFYERPDETGSPDKIITNGKSSESDRLYLYKSSEE